MPAVLLFVSLRGNILSPMAKGETPAWVDLDTDALPFIRLMIQELNSGGGRMRPLTIKGLRLAKQIARPKLCPPNAAGQYKWGYPLGDAQCFEANLVRFGIDPKTGYLIDQRKWTDELGRMRAEQVEKAILKDQEELKEGVRKALRKYGRSQPPIPTATQLLANAKLEQGITKAVLNGESASTSPWPKKIAAPDDYVPGAYGTPIDDEDPSAKSAKPKPDMTKPGWWRRRS